MPRNPPIMPGWDGFPIPERLSSQFGALVLVDNDVNIMALGEHWAQEQLLASIREVVYQRSLPLATRHLRVVRSPLDDRAGVVGAVAMVTERVLALDPDFAWPAGRARG